MIELFFLHMYSYAEVYAVLSAWILVPLVFLFGLVWLQRHGGVTIELARVAETGGRAGGAGEDGDGRVAELPLQGDAADSPEQVAEGEQDEKEQVKAVGAD